MLLLVLPDRADGNIIKTIGSIADSYEDLAGNLTPVGVFSENERQMDIIPAAAASAISSNCEGGEA